MERMLRWLESAGAWVPSRFGGLPDLDRIGDPQLRQWGAFAGGLALILSRCSQEEAARQYANAQLVHHQVRRSLRRGKAPKIPSQVLVAALREVDVVADPLTRAAGLSCMRRKPARAGESPSEAALASAMERTFGTLGGSTMASVADFDDADTQLSADIFSRRSDALRQTVAGQRTGGPRS